MRRLPLIVVIGLLAPLPPARGAEKNDAAIGYLRKLQNPDGGFSPALGKDLPSSLRATSSAIRALKYFGSELPNREACSNFVKSCHDKASGGFTDTPGGKPDVALTAVGLMAVVELKIPLDDYEAGAVNYLSKYAQSFDDIRIAVAGLEAVGKKAPANAAWLEKVEKMRNADGTFGEGGKAARETGGATVALLRLGARMDDPKAVLKVLNAGQHEVGGWSKGSSEPAELESTYRVMRAFHMLRVKPEGAAKVRAFVRSCGNPDGGFGLRPGAPSAVGPTYFAAIILHWLD
jgi:hypothetical protein